MKTIHLFALLFSLSLVIGCGPDAAKTDVSKSEMDTASTESGPESASLKITDQIVEASCGQCQFDMDGNGCDLAIRIDGKSYLVDGSSIDDHGDAHANDGLCNCIRQAKVSGEIKDERFVATQIQVMPNDQ